MIGNHFPHSGVLVVAMGNCENVPTFASAIDPFYICVHLLTIEMLWRR